MCSGVFVLLSDVGRSRSSSAMLQGWMQRGSRPYRLTVPFLCDCLGPSPIRLQIFGGAGQLQVTAGLMWRRGVNVDRYTKLQP